MLAARENILPAGNDMAKGGTRPARKRKHCEAMKGADVKGWVGTVRALRSSGKGDGILAVAIGDHVILHTYVSEDNAIKSGSKLFEAVSALSKGDRVAVSGRLFRGSDVDCFKETSFTTSGSMEEPEFLFRFEAVERVP